METLYKTSYTEDAIIFFRNLAQNKDLHSFKASLIDYQKLKRILVMRNQFFYITDVIDFSNIFVSKTLPFVLGYQPEDFMDLGFVYHVIHPEDTEFVFAFSKKIIEWSYMMGDALRCDQFAGVFSIDFRIRHSHGHYVRLNRQTSCYRTDNDGNMIYSLSHFTDISHIKKSNLITYSWKTEVNIDFHFDDLVEKFQQSILTTREVEIIRYLSQGFSATQIGKKLFISEHTVIAHRKNILHKLKVKNSAELVKVVVEMGLL